MKHKLKPATRAKRMAERAKKAAADPLNAGKYFDRVFESWVECGDGDQVILAFLELYGEDEALVEAVDRVTHWIPIDEWLAWRDRRCPSLFEEGGVA